MLEGQLAGGTRDRLSRTQARRCVFHAHPLSAGVGKHFLWATVGLQPILVQLES